MSTKRSFPFFESCLIGFSLSSRLIYTHTHTHPFNGPLSGTTRVGRYQRGKTKLDFTEARDSEWHWHQLGHMQVCTSLQTDNHASTPPLSCFTGWMPFLPPNQQRQSTEGVNAFSADLTNQKCHAHTYEHSAFISADISLYLTIWKRLSS